MNKIDSMNFSLMKTVFLSTVILGAYFLRINPVLADHNNYNQLSLDLSLDSPLVYQLNNVQSTDWAFLVLKELIEKYSINNGQFQLIFNNVQELTRDEFAIIFDEIINQILEQNNLNYILPEDLTKIQQLQNQFALELAILKGRNDGLEARITEQELTKFSTTTQLTGIANFNLSGVIFADQIKAEGLNQNLALRGENNQPIQRQIDQQNLTISHRLELSLNTSFNGDDLLLTKLVMSNNNHPINQLMSTGNFDRLGVNFNNSQVGGDDQFIIEELWYQLPINNPLQLVIAPRVNWSNYFNKIVNFIPNNFNQNLVSPMGQGTGIIVLWAINDQLQLNTAYLTENNTRLNSSNSAGNRKNSLFEGTNSLSSELTYSPSHNFNFQLLYQQIFNLEIDQNGQVSSLPVWGVIDDGEGGKLKGGNSQMIGLGFDWFIDPEIRLFGSYNYSSTKIEPRNVNLNYGLINSQQIQTGINILDLGKEGTITSFIYTIPFDLLTGKNYLVAGGGNGTMTQEFEASYYFPVNDYLALVPTFYLIVNPNQFNNNNVYVGNLQMQLLF